MKTPQLMIRLHMTEPEIELVLGALSFLEGEAMVDHEELRGLEVLTLRLRAKVNAPTGVNHARDPRELGYG